MTEESSKSDRGITLKKAMIGVLAPIVGGALGFFGQMAAEYVLKFKFDMPTTATAGLFGVCGFLLFLLFNEREARKAVEAEVTTLAGKVGELKGELRVYQPAIIPELQEIRSRFELDINDDFGDDAEATKESVFRVLVEGIELMREEITFDGTVDLPSFSLEHYDGDYERDLNLHIADPILDPKHWQKVPGEPTVRRGDPPWKTDWVVTLPHVLEKGHIYKKILKFAPKTAYSAAEEYQMHRFTTEAVSEVQVCFSPGYGKGLPKKWLDGSAPPPVAFIRRRLHDASSPILPPQRRSGGAVSFSYRMVSPQVGDRFRMEWKNPNGRPKA